MDTTKRTMPFSGDRPIANRNEDRFGRVRFADALSQQVTQAPKGESFVMGLVGPWGSGKTSVLNLVEESLAKEKTIKVFKFNPWLFSGTEQLLGEFFGELVHQMRAEESTAFKEVGEVLEKYCDLLSPVKYIPVFGEPAGQALEAGKALGQFIGWKTKGKGDSIQDQKKKVEELLRKSTTTFVVVIDDLDRLEPHEIREMMRLVRLVGDFPNVTYILAFDRGRIEKSLDETGVNGRAYLEKIIQVTYNLPMIRPTELASFLGGEIEGILNATKTSPFKNEDLVNVFHKGLRPLFKTPRDVRRFMNALPVTFGTVGDEVSPIDVIALEAVRLLVPDVYVLLAEAEDALTAVRGDYSSRSDEAQKKEQGENFKELIEAAGEHKDTITRLFEEIFPGCKRFTANTYYSFDSQQEWRRQRRVAHPEVLAFYLEKSLPAGVLPAQLVDDVYASLGDADKLEVLIKDMDGKELEHLFSRLVAYEREFKPDSVKSAIKTILNHADKLRTGKAYMWDFGSSIHVGRLTLRLLRVVKTEEERKKIAEEVVLQVPSLSWQLDLIDTVGHIKGLGHKLVSEADAKALEDSMSERIAAASIEQLSKERDLPRLINMTVNGTPQQKAAIKDKLGNDDLFLNLLDRSISQVHSQYAGEVATRVTDRLPWAWLLGMVGEAEMKARVEELSKKIVASDSRAKGLELAKKYISGELKEERRGETSDQPD